MASFINAFKSVFTAVGDAAVDLSAASAPPGVGDPTPAAPVAPSDPASAATASSAPAGGTPTSKPQLYFPAPPIISSITSYQDINNDSKLQDMETEYFLERTKEYIKRDKSWKKLKKFSKYLKGEDGYEITYKILRLFVKRGNTNWYDLQMQEELVMDFIKHKLTKLGSA
uniref:Uncharacterized protein n=1 Tax=viral metagenome TaxID=1070528 RepID=A0A6C0HVN0_9ZZZZ